MLFIDEIHRLPRAAEELLYIAMEDFRVDVMVGKGPGASSILLTLPRFTGDWCHHARRYAANTVARTLWLHRTS